MSRSDTPENRIKAEVLKYLKLWRIYCWSNPSGAARIRPGKFMSFGLKGSADILGCLPDGRFLAVEVKAARGVLSPEQRDFLADIKALGGMAVVAKSRTDVDHVLREGGYVSDGPLFDKWELWKYQPDKKARCVPLWPRSFPALLPISGGGY
jgi:hypothetical protein